MKYLTKKSWNQFRNTGLLWFINTTLHLFGWAIVIDYKDFKKKIIEEVYPARCKFRGFHKEGISKGYIKVTKYLKRNINQLEKECKL